MNLDEYIKKNFDNSETWFQDEVNKPHHTRRISEVYRNKDYLVGRHKVLSREDSVYKGKVLITRKTIIQYVKTLLTFHDSLILGKPVSLVSDDMETQKTVTDIYRLGGFNSADYKILDRVNKFGDSYEYLYIEDGVIKSRVFDSADSYPVYSDDGEYLAFIESWTDAWSNITYWNVYYPDRVEYWNNEGAELNHTETKRNLSGLPIHYHNINDEDDMFGRSILDDLIPIMDELEDILSKLGDSVYVYMLNPLPVAIGQRIESSIPADATGYVLNLDMGSFDYKNATIDYNTVKLYLDNLKNMLQDVACFPSALSGNTNVANVSSVSLQMLFHLAISKAYENEKWLTEGFMKRFEVFRKLLAMQGQVLKDVHTSFNLNIPVAQNEVVSNLKTMVETGAMSKVTAMEKSGLIDDVAVELERLEDEPKVNGGSENEGVEV